MYYENRVHIIYNNNTEKLDRDLAEGWMVKFNPNIAFDMGSLRGSYSTTLYNETRTVVVLERKIED